MFFALYDMGYPLGVSVLLSRIQNLINMDINEKAKDYAEGKATAAIEQAIAKAFADGYKSGYEDGEKSVPVENNIDEFEWIDLGLPSGTLWAIPRDEGGKLISLTYLNADKKYNLPTMEQVLELEKYCCHIGCKSFRGPNGNIIKFPQQWNHTQAPSEDFWIKTDSSEEEPLRSYFDVGDEFCIDKCSLSSVKVILVVHSE